MYFIAGPSLYAVMPEQTELLSLSLS